MPEALYFLVFVAGGVLIVLGRRAIAAKIVGSQRSAGRAIGGPYERLVAPPSDSVAAGRMEQGLRVFLAVFGIAWIILATYGYIASI